MRADRDTSSPSATVAVLTCAQCGKTFTRPVKHVYPHTRFCSLRCVALYWQSKRREEQVK